MASEWGRKETVIWPPQVPIYTYGALLLAVPIAITLLTTLYIMKPFLTKNYTGAFIKATIGSEFHRHQSYRLIFLGGGKNAPRVAQPGDFESGSTVMPDGKEISTALSASATSQGYTTVFRGPERKFADDTIYAWLKSDIFAGESILETYDAPFIETALIVVFLLCFAVPADFKRAKRMKYGRLLRGPEMHSPREFNRTMKGQGIGIRTTDKGTIIRLPLRSEPKHIEIMGDTGVGKSQLLRQILSQVADRGESAIVYDPAGEFVQRFYREGRGDVILNPLDKRAPYWDPSSELRNPAEARTIAASLYQPTSDKKGEFFTETPQKIFAHLLKYRPTPEQLVEWMSNEKEIDRRVEGTELAAMIPKDAPDQRNGVLGSLGLIADSFRLLPNMKEAGGRAWSATKWAEKREGWIFLSSTEEAEQEALRPMHSLWLDLLILRLLAPPKEGQKRAWFVIDELATLQRLPQFHTALTKGRKSDNPIVFGYQGKAQLEVIYGHLAEVMLSMPSTKIVMKTGEPKAAKWASELIGEIEIERVRETVADGKRAGKSFTLDRQIEPLVMASEVEGLADLHAFLKIGNHVTRFSFPHVEMPLIAPGLVPREIAEHQEWLKELGPEPVVADSARQPAAAPASPVATALAPAENVQPRPAEQLTFIVPATPPPPMKPATGSLTPQASEL